MPEGARHALTEQLSPTDLQSLLLEVTRHRAGAVAPARLMQRWKSDRFVHPAAIDPRRASGPEARLWQLLPDTFEGLELSPVTPLGTCKALGAADQNRVLSTIRNSEVVSDLTNVLALEAATRRRADPDRPVHLAACHRLLRNQQFPSGWSSHFKLFALVSSARDRGSGRTEAELLIAHLAYWQRVLRNVLPRRSAQIGYSIFDHPVLDQRFTDTVLPALHVPGEDQLDWVPDPERTRARGYYTSGALLIHADGAELGDGGFTDWTARLLADRKERCLISCLSIEGLLGLDPAIG
ncbi:hypothetical protein [Microlunatus elymi]|uniref:hypothetical protein n=1 Tax=Microlunatus elymi TaxID=2596828 RepID=UPI001D19583F|nr:hypothetical protein [Microlunatus elymi]